MLYSPEYKKQQESLHEKGDYGVMGGMYAPLVSQIIDKLEVDNLLDYGCGKNLSLFKALKPERKFKYQAYDPMVDKFSAAPKPSQMVVCCDVLEHIEPDYLDEVLDHIQEMTEEVAFLSVCSAPARKVLSDGRNAHLIQQPLSWWLPKIWERFNIQSVQRMSDTEFYTIVYADD